MGTQDSPCPLHSLITLSARTGGGPQGVRPCFPPAPTLRAREGSISTSRKRWWCHCPTAAPFRTLWQDAGLHLERPQHAEGKVWSTAHPEYTQGTATSLGWLPLQLPFDSPRPTHPSALDPQKHLLSLHLVGSQSIEDLSGGLRARNLMPLFCMGNRARRSQVLVRGSSVESE